MGKKIKYGDPRLLDHTSFTEDFLDDEFLKNYWDERKRQSLLYNEIEVHVPKEGTVMNVKYVGQSQGFFVFDGNFKDYVRVEDRLLESKYLKNTQIGDSVDVFILSVDENNYDIRGSVSAIYESKARTEIFTFNHEHGVPVLCDVKDLTPAGYFVEIYWEKVTLQGFMPNTLAGINKLSNPESLLGQSLEVMIESFSKEEGTYIVSRRRFLQTLIPQAMSKLQNGVVYTGNVTGTTQFGVFVEFTPEGEGTPKCLTGMIHKTNLQQELQDRLQDIPAGAEIEFYIKEIIKDKIILTQVLRETLWDTIRVGQVLQGKVRDLKNFGALVTLDPETNGLIHTSELDKSTKAIKSGEDVKVKVIAVERMNRKIYLSIQ